MKVLLFLLWMLLILLVLLFVVPIRVICRADSRVAGADFRLAMRVLGIRISLLPRKKRRPNIQKFRRAALEKTLAEKKKKEDKKAKKQKNKQAKKADATATGAKITNFVPKNKRDIMHLIKLALTVVRVFLARFGAYLRVDIKQFDIVCAAKDPADAAILYGWVYTAMETFWGTVQGTKPFSRVRKDSISIYADFLNTKPAFRAHLVFSIALWQIAAILIRSGSAALAFENDRRKNESKEEKAARLAKEAKARATIIKELKK